MWRVMIKSFSEAHATSTATAVAVEKPRHEIGYQRLQKLFQEQAKQAEAVALQAPRTRRKGSWAPQQGLGSGRVPAENEFGALHFQPHWILLVERSERQNSTRCDFFLHENEGHSRHCRSVDGCHMSGCFDEQTYYFFFAFNPGNALICLALCKFSVSQFRRNIIEPVACLTGATCHAPLGADILHFCLLKH